MNLLNDRELEVVSGGHCVCFLGSMNFKMHEVYINPEPCIPFCCNEPPIGNTWSLFTKDGTTYTYSSGGPCPNSGDTRVVSACNATKSGLSIGVRPPQSSSSSCSLL